MNTPEYSRAYYQANREEKLEWQRRYYAEHREQGIERARRQREAASAEELREYQREASRTIRHGITRTIRDWMYDSQDQACAGCKTPMADAELEVDHDHACCPRRQSCGRCVRGLVCHSCNVLDVMAEVFA